MYSKIHINDKNETFFRRQQKINSNRTTTDKSSKIEQNVLRSNIRSVYAKCSVEKVYSRLPCWYHVGDEWGFETNNKILILYFQFVLSLE